MLAKPLTPGGLEDHHPLDLRQLQPQSGNPDRRRPSIGAQSFEEMLAVYITTTGSADVSARRLSKLMQVNLMLDVMDDNIDGKLQLAELKGGPQSPGTMLKKFFPMIDTNHDGALDPAELAAAAKLMPRRGGAPKQAAAPSAPPAQPAATTTPTAGGR